ncbi:MAG: HNH endonuclease [Chloroflexi bacterium HGW-Chloroflexi-1]|nr:MAG: HNH endonuclease [Chloroflexi bacterium HGW-Chloroflexi-1]
MSSYISDGLRELVARRAEHLCEYCLIHEDDTHFGCQVDHIISVKHGGPTTAENLAYACAFCNRQKGSDVGSVWETGEFTRFLNPRTDHWADHFRLDGVVIKPLTKIGEVTARILDFNNTNRLLERQELIDLGRYSPAPALKHLVK